MNYAQLIQAYFERSYALQWYWTVYVMVIGGVLGFSVFRQRREPVTTVLLTILFCCFAYKNLTAIEATAEEREAIRSAFKQFPATGASAADINLAREKIEPALPPYDIPGARYFHIACALLTIVFIWAKEWRRARNDTVRVAVT
jgi:TctA family transporter